MGDLSSRNRSGKVSDSSDLNFIFPSLHGGWIFHGIIHAFLAGLSLIGYGHLRIIQWGCSRGQRHLGVFYFWSCDLEFDHFGSGVVAGSGNGDLDISFCYVIGVAEVIVTAFRQRPLIIHQTDGRRQFCSGIEETLSYHFGPYFFCNILRLDREEYVFLAGISAHTMNHNHSGTGIDIIFIGKGILLACF